jgi:hypothetical protein
VGQDQDLKSKDDNSAVLYSRLRWKSHRLTADADVAPVLFPIAQTFMAAVVFLAGVVTGDSIPTPCGIYTGCTPLVGGNITISDNITMTVCDVVCVCVCACVTMCVDVYVLLREASYCSQSNSLFSRTISSVCETHSVDL